MEVLWAVSDLRKPTATPVAYFASLDDAEVWRDVQLGEHGVVEADHEAAEGIERERGRARRAAVSSNWTVPGRGESEAAE